MDVYPTGRTVWSTIVLFGTFAAVCVIWAVSAIADGSNIRGWWVAAVGLVIFPWGFWRAIGQQRHPLPFAHLDEEGLDCALGLVPWRNVLNASVEWHWVWAGRGSHPSRRLFLDLRNPDEPPAATTRMYLSGMPFAVPVESDGKLRVPLWGSKDRVVADIGRYYPAG
jgi:hypothetical protein